MRKKAIILVAACVMIIVVNFFVFFVFRTPTQQTTKDPYFAAYYNEFNKTPKLTYIPILSLHQFPCIARY